MNVDKKDMQLYAVTDRSWLKGDTLYHQVEQALKGGATFVQLREKELDQETFLQEAKEIKALCASYHVPFVINDNVDIALAIDADGVHVGQSDMEAGDVRQKLGRDKIIGVSAGTVEQALLAQERGADANNLSPDILKNICDAVDIPVVAIGGITKDNIKELKGSGIDGIAVVSAIFAAEDIENATKELKENVKSILPEK